MSETFHVFSCLMPSFSAYLLEMGFAVLDAGVKDYYAARQRTVSQTLTQIDPLFAL
jgi:hypothetical protein